MERARAACLLKFRKQMIQSERSSQISQITFFRVSRDPKRCSGIFNVLKAWTNMWNKMMEEKAGVERQNSKKGFEKNEHACNAEGVFVVLP